MFQGSFLEVTRKLRECFKKVSMVFHKSFKGVSRKIEECLKGSFQGVSKTFERNSKVQICCQGVPRNFHECSKKYFQVLQRSLMGVSRKIEDCFIGVLSGCQGRLKEVQMGV